MLTRREQHLTAPQLPQPLAQMAFVDPYGGLMSAPFALPMTVYPYQGGVMQGLPGQYMAQGGWQQKANTDVGALTERMEEMRFQGRENGGGQQRFGPSPEEQYYSDMSGARGGNSNRRWDEPGNGNGNRRWDDGPGFEPGYNSRNANQRMDWNSPRREDVPRGGGGMQARGGWGRQNNGARGPQQQPQQPRRSQKGMEDKIKRTIYISSIDLKVTEAELANFFSDCGRVVDCRICGDPNMAMRFAFIEFQNNEGVQQALGMSGVVLMDLPLRILPSKTAIMPVSKELMPRSQEEIERCSRTVYVANIDKKVNKEDVRNFFEELCGKVSKLRLLGDHAHPTRIAFVEFVLAEGAMAALHCSGALLGNLPLRVSPSKTPVRPDLALDAPGGRHSRRGGDDGRSSVTSSDDASSAAAPVSAATAEELLMLQQEQQEDAAAAVPAAGSAAGAEQEGQEAAAAAAPGGDM